MIIIGELINSTRKKIKEAIANGDSDYIQSIAKKQVLGGADFVDVNAGAFVHDEVKYLLWLVEVVQQVCDKPLALDSPNPKALEEAIKIHQGTPMINSITMEQDRFAKILPLVKEYDAKVIALCMDDKGMPETATDRLKIAEKLINELDKEGVKPDRVFLDPLIKPISVNGEYGLQALDTISGIAAWKTGAHITCGLSNISYGLPKRMLLNQAFLVMAMTRGLDSAIIDPTEKQMTSLIKAAEVLLNKDDFGMEYIRASRADELV